MLSAVEPADDGRPPVARRRQREGVGQAVPDLAPLIQISSQLGWYKNSMVVDHATCHSIYIYRYKDSFIRPN